MTSPQASASFDARPLTDPVDPAAVRAFTAELRSRRTTGMAVSSIIAIVAVAIAGVVLLPILASVVVALAAGSGSPPPRRSRSSSCSWWRRGWASSSGWASRNARTARYRLQPFRAGQRHDIRAAGRRSPAPRHDLPPRPFAPGHRPRPRTHPRFVEFGNYQYTVQSGKNSTTYRWGYVAVKLDVPLPNIVLDAKGNNGFGSNLPASFQRAQRLSLEGDLRSALHPLLPRRLRAGRALPLHARHHGALHRQRRAARRRESSTTGCSSTRPRRASTLDPATWAWLFGTVGALLTKLDQWARWRDDRLAAAATPGGHALPFAPPAGMITPHRGSRRRVGASSARARGSRSSW
ncbi:hypothetical protein AB1285_20610 [Microbacterium sp. NRRL B-14842]|uniref:hypothetical protein n=1 Tax=Microbacterium sp. NRRL B-14842 TaxID=3162881 RepID=UPI003D2A30F3